MQVNSNEYNYETSKCSISTITKIITHFTNPAAEKAKKSPPQHITALFSDMRRSRQRNARIDIIKIWIDLITIFGQK